MTSKARKSLPDLSPAPDWDFLTNHAHVFTCVARDPGARLRDIAQSVGITERAAHRILSQLIDDGYVLREKEGRRNRYEVVAELPMRHPLVERGRVGDLLEVLVRAGTRHSAGGGPGSERSGRPGDGRRQ